MDILEMFLVLSSLNVASLSTLMERTIVLESGIDRESVYNKLVLLMSDSGLFKSILLCLI